MIGNILQFLMSRGSTQTESDPPAVDTNEADADEPTEQGTARSPLSGLLGNFLNRRKAIQKQPANQSTGRQPNGRNAGPAGRMPSAQQYPGMVQQPRGRQQQGVNPYPYGQMMPPMQGMPRGGSRSNHSGRGRMQQQPMQPYGHFPYGGSPSGNYPNGSAYGGGFGGGHGFGFGLPGAPMMPSQNAGRGGSRGRSRSNPQPFTPFPPAQPYPYPQQNFNNRQNRNQRRNTPPPYHPWPF